MSCGIPAPKVHILCSLELDSGPHPHPTTTSPALMTTNEWGREVHTYTVNFTLSLGITHIHTETHRACRHTTQVCTTSIRTVPGYTYPVKAYTVTHTSGITLPYAHTCTHTHTRYKYTYITKVHPRPHVQPPPKQTQHFSGRPMKGKGPLTSHSKDTRVEHWEEGLATKGNLKKCLRERDTLPPFGLGT